MHINHRRKNRHRCYKFRSPHPWFPWARFRPRYDYVSLGGYFGRSFYVQILNYPSKRYRTYERRMIRTGRYDDILDWLPYRWEIDT